MPRKIENDWFDGAIPDNITLGSGTHIETSQCFEIFRGKHEDALVLGACTSVYPPTIFDIGSRGRVSVGPWTMLNGPRIICDQEISIGAYSLIAWNVVLMDSYRTPKDPTVKPIKIGINVWIGFDSIVLPGVTIGNHAIVGARSVVNQDVPPYATVAGNPARIVDRGQRWF